MPTDGLPPTAEIRKQLLTRLSATLARQAGVENRLRHKTSLPDKWIDRAPLLGDEEVLAELDEEGRHEVAALRAALERLENGTWGVCIGCADPIPAARLLALPTAAHCVECAE
jgi:RNA polymerase-binding transcription factor DksA